MKRKEYDNISDVIIDAHKFAVERGFWQEEWTNEYMFGLLVVELGELLHAFRDVRHARREGFTQHMEEVYRRATGRLHEHWVNAYHVYIKDTFEDEMADVVILLANLAGHRGYDITDIRKFADTIPMSSPLPEFIYRLTTPLGSMPPSEYIAGVIAEMFSLAEYHHVDLWWHIQEKLRYNNIRPRTHHYKKRKP